MRFNKHFDLEGRHASLSPSKPQWLGYDDDKFDRIFTSEEAARKGTRLHKLAADLIRDRVRLEDNGTTLSMYVNDCIGFRMSPEQPLFYSDNAFGTADALGLFGIKLRVSDLKNGFTPAQVEQLKIYAALFCLEYRYKAFELEFELRVYQNDECRLYEVDPVEIDLIMKRIEYLDKRIQYLKEELSQ